MSKTRQLPQLESVQRISKLPVVETSVQIASGLYDKIKNSNPLVKWYFRTVVEGGVTFVIHRSLTAVPLLELPISVADTIVCKGLDTVQQRMPAINYPPEKIIYKTKDYVANNIVQPVLKRAESAKDLAVQEATKYGELAATRIDTALNVADKYVEKYLPDASDTTDGNIAVHDGESKAIQTIESVNRLSRKLQRRLTKRTIAEARALKRQGTDAAHILLKLAELMVKDPKGFAARMKAIWEHLSQDEPENQVPPANLEQLIAMITRETARRFVHLTNYTVKRASKLPSYTKDTLQFIAHHANILLDEALKIVHLEGAKTVAISRAKSQIRNLNITLRDVQILVENLLSNLLSNSKHKSRAEVPIPLHTLSPVAQSPERTQEPTVKPEVPQPQKQQENHAENQQQQQQQQQNNVESKQQHNKSNSPKKQRKNKTTNVVNPPPPTSEIEQHIKFSDVNSNGQPIRKGEIYSSPE